MTAYNSLKVVSPPPSPLTTAHDWVCQISRDLDRSGALQPQHVVEAKRLSSFLIQAPWDVSSREGLAAICETLTRDVSFKGVWSLARWIESRVSETNASVSSPQDLPEKEPFVSLTKWKITHPTEDWRKTLCCVFFKESRDWEWSNRKNFVSRGFSFDTQRGLFICRNNDSAVTQNQKTEFRLDLSTGKILASNKIPEYPPHEEFWTRVHASLKLNDQLKIPSLSEIYPEQTGCIAREAAFVWRLLNRAKDFVGAQSWPVGHEGKVPVRTKVHIVLGLTLDGVVTGVQVVLPDSKNLIATYGMPALGQMVILSCLLKTHDESRDRDLQYQLGTSYIYKAPVLSPIQRRLLQKIKEGFSR